MYMLANCEATRCVGFLANNQPLRGNGERIRPARVTIMSFCGARKLCPDAAFVRYYIVAGGRILLLLIVKL